MQCWRRVTSILLFALPLLVAAIPASTEDTPSSEYVQTGSDSTSSYPIDLTGSRLKIEVGTKDAPVDGKDGKPHAGPWVNSDRDSMQDLPKNNNPTSSLEEVLAEDTTDELVLADGTKLPPARDGGVMDDPHRVPPKEGTTGTEGGVSEKDKARKLTEGKTGEKIVKVPDSPKEAPPLPHSEQDGRVKANRLKEMEGENSIENAEGVHGLETLSDLPNDFSSQSNPLLKSATKDYLDMAKSELRPIYDDLEQGDASDSLIQPLHSLILSLTMILVSEIGDKTFLIAALMAMKHPRFLVFSAAFSALITMTILSAILGHAVPTLVPQRFTNFLAAALFLIFGIRMLREGLAMNPNEGVAAEMQEVEMELAAKETLAQQRRRRSSVSPYNLELGLGDSSRKSRSGTRLPELPPSPSSAPDRSPSPSRSSIKNTLGGLTNLLSLLLSPAWVQTFAMTFLGEWGDRSQIATIAMAAGQDYWWVTGGAITGHAVCTGVAVVGGRAIAGKVGLRVVTLGGAIAFLIFGLIYLIQALYYA